VKFLFFGDKLRKVHAMRETFDRKIIYLDNAATSWPKPEAVYEAVDHAMRYSGNASRSGHRLALEADRLLYQTRKLWNYLTIRNGFSKVVNTYVTIPLQVCYGST